tara:strand:- start:648 stop:1364 length:717 start_codon:yes stop_codon:yes gene_type:complete
MKKRTALHPHTPIILPNWAAPARIKSLFTTKSQDPSATQTLAKYLPEAADFKRAIDPVRLHQTHSAIVHRIEKKVQGLLGDALVTSAINIPCSIEVADCVPVLLCSENGKEIAAIHAGWRGLLAGLIENTTKSLSNPPSKIKAWIGPAISKSVYSVGNDLRKPFCQKNPHYENFFEEIKNKIYFDLREAVNYTLRSSGISNISQTTRCVYQESESFFSFRREKTKDRMIGIIWISDDP